MARLKLQQGEGNKILRAKSQPIKKITKEITKLIADMKETCVAENGLGLAAPQVGHNLQLAICVIEKMMIPVLNPEILEMSDETENSEEGCLSLPGNFMKVRRARSLTVKFQDQKGHEQILKLSGLNARVVQHEVDHLNGILIIDRAFGKKL